MDFQTSFEKYGWWKSVMFSLMFRGVDADLWNYNHDSDYFLIRDPAGVDNLILQCWTTNTPGEVADFVLFHYNDVVGGDGPMEGTYLAKGIGLVAAFDLLCTAMQYMEGMVSWEEIRKSYEDRLDRQIEVADSKWIICPHCDGEGKSSAHLGDVTEMIADDPDWAEDYFEGVYDRPCPCCGGAGKVRYKQWVEYEERLAERRQSLLEDGIRPDF